MTVAAASFLDRLQSAASHADKAEGLLREEMSRRLKVIEEDRKFAYRRFNLMRAVAESVAAAESKEIAVANALAVLRNKLGWSSDSEARQAVLSRFAPVTEAAFANLAPPEAKAAEPGTPEIDVLSALTEFETWYAQSHPRPFWVLFEHYIPETPVVDF